MKCYLAVTSNEYNINHPRSHVLRGNAARTLRVHKSKKWEEADTK